MSLEFNGVSVTSVFFNGAEMDSVLFNGIEVFTIAPSGTVEQKTISVTDGGITWSMQGYDSDKIRLDVAPVTGTYTPTGFVQVNPYGGMLGQASVENDTSGNPDFFVLQGLGGGPTSGLRIGAIDNEPIANVLLSPALTFNQLTGFTGGTVQSPSADGFRYYKLQGSGFNFRFSVFQNGADHWSDWLTITQATL